MERRNMMSNLSIILSEYKEYENKSSDEIQKEILPIIKNRGVKSISNFTGLSVHSLYRYCKKLFVKEDMRPDFISYCKILDYEEKYLKSILGGNKHE